MKLVKYNIAKSNSGGSVVVGGGSSSEISTETRGSATLDRTIWGKEDTGDDIDGHMTVNGDIRIKVIDENRFYPDDDEPGEDEEYDEGGGNLYVDEDVHIGRHLYITHSHTAHDTDEKCVSELIKSCEDGIATNKSDISGLKTRMTTTENDIKILLPIGSIIAFNGGSPLPAHWAICDGTNGTPDLRGKFIK